jgi:hypothetical protein
MHTLTVPPNDDWHSRNHARREEQRAAWAGFLGRVPWQLFVTLTFDPKRHAADSVTASREAFWWCCQTARIYRVPAAWAYAPERGFTGLWHAHVLMVGTPMRIPEACGMWKARNGHIDVRPVTDRQGASLYTSKSAALTGDIVWSDTCRRHMSSAEGRIALYPDRA